MSESEPWQILLREALAVLALSPDEQIRVNGPGCVVCDLLEDFEHARMVALGNAAGIVSDEQRGLLDRIDTVMKGMQEPDLDCGNNQVNRRPVWQQLRELAANALRAFGWEHATVLPFVEVEPGVWQRPPSER